MDDFYTEYLDPNDDMKAREEAKEIEDLEHEAGELSFYEEFDYKFKSTI